MTSLSWRRSLSLWARCRGCTRYVSLHVTLSVAGLSHTENVYHTTYIMQQSQLKGRISGIGFFSPTDSTGQTTEVTGCYIYHTTTQGNLVLPGFSLKALVQTGHLKKKKMHHRLTFKRAILFFQNCFQYYKLFISQLSQYIE